MNGESLGAFEFGEAKKGTPSPAQLGLKLLKNLPKLLTQSFRVMVLADTAFSSADFIHGVRSLKYHAVTGLLSSRRLTDGRLLSGTNCP
ncbi:hypothetical protein CI593_08920 [Fischerella thermalis CCMEE 5194]|nr:hypothetical protein CI593_08920 [Fischerella thermalis CCMEE 5194]